MAVKLSDLFKKILFDETGYYSIQDKPKIIYADCSVEYVEEKIGISEENKKLIDLDDIEKMHEQYVESMDFDLDITNLEDKYSYIGLNNTQVDRFEDDPQRGLVAEFKFYKITTEDNVVTFADPYTELEVGYDFVEVDPSFQVFGLGSNNPNKLQLSSDRIQKQSSKCKYYLFFDVETNGLPKNWNAPINDLDNWPRIVQLAWILYDTKANILYQNESIIKPEGFQISSQSEEIHGISNVYAEKHGRALVDVLMDFSGPMLADYLVAHNLDFDMNVLGAEYLRVFSKNPLSNLNGICTMKGTTEFCALTTESGNKWPKLDELYFTLFGSSFEHQHDAKFDVEATAKCFWELRKRGVL